MWNSGYASCAKCNEPLINGHISYDNGDKVQVSSCPNCEGKIKSPQCCGSDMNCSLLNLIITHNINCALFFTIINHFTIINVYLIFIYILYLIILFLNI